MIDLETTLHQRQVDIEDNNYRSLYDLLTIYMYVSAIKITEKIVDIPNGTNCESKVCLVLLLITLHDQT